MIKERLIEIKESLESAWYYFINTTQKEVIDYQIINLLEQLIDKITQRMEFTPFKDELESNAE